jgi:hypothetical protein
MNVICYFFVVYIRPYYRYNISHIPNNNSCVPLINQLLNTKSLPLVSCGNPKANILPVFHISKKLMDFF